MAENLPSASGWSCDVGGSWVASDFVLSSDALGLRQPEVSPEWHSIALADVVGLDQVAGADGTPVFEFVLAGGVVLTARLPDVFVEAVVGALRENRAVAEREVPSTDGVPSDPNAPHVPPAGSPDLPDPPPPPAGRRTTRRVLEQEIQELRAYVESLGLEDRRALRADIESLSAHRMDVLAEVRAATLERRSLEAELVRVRREAILQDAGVYHPRSPVEDSPELADRLQALRTRVDDMIHTGGAITSADDWTVNGSRSEGRKVVDELSKLLLRTYNAECDLLEQTMRPFEVDAAIDRLTVTRDAISRLGRSMQLAITEEFHRARIDLLVLTADHLAALDAGRVPPADPDAGFVYVASNLGSLGEVVRVGVTRSADEQRLRAELDGTHLPFPSDVHTIVAVDDPQAVLAAIRSALHDRRVNLADPSCTFFRATPAHVRDILVAAGVEPLWYRTEALAEQWRLTENMSGEAD